MVLRAGGEELWESVRRRARAELAAACRRGDAGVARALLGARAASALGGPRPGATGTVAAWVARLAQRRFGPAPPAADAAGAGGVAERE